MIRMPLKTTSICVVDKTIMDNTHPFAKDSESLLASDSEDGEPYVPVRQKAPRRIPVTAALTIVNLAAFLATMVF